MLDWMKRIDVSLASLYRTRGVSLLEIGSEIRGRTTLDQT